MPLLQRIRFGVSPTPSKRRLLRCGSGAVSSGDPFWTDVVLLMGFQGSDGDTGSPGMSDQSSAAHGTATLNGSGPSISTALSQFGVSSYNNTNNTDIVYFPDSADWDFGAGPFTVEVSAYASALSVQEFLIGQYPNTAGILSWGFFINSGLLTFIFSTDGTSAHTFSVISGTGGPGGAIVLNDWNVLCADYDGIKYRVYIGGVMVGSFSTPKTIFNSNAVLAVGGSGTSLNFNSWVGNLANLRVAKGVARYASDGGYVPATGPFPAHG